ncbi:MAG: GNAT family N-acetyltransferase [Salaquimonas sp.]|jgi:GNAT superfamily N-acetyltransferase|nr:GNAT family N-acetyltransferase [Salaquimonas sp.]
MADLIRAAASSDDYRYFAELIREYVAWCRERYTHDSRFIDSTFDHQSLDRELDQLELSYGPPRGRAFLSLRGDEVTGGVAYRRLTDDICEMKRLYVRRQFHGSGTGSALCSRVVAQARRDGFSLMRLDTANLLHEAIALYRSIGFVECAPYITYPENIMPYIMFMEMRLK